MPKKIKVNLKMYGLEQIERDIKRLGKVPQVAANRAAKAGAKIAYKDAKRKAPKLTGDLKKGLIMIKEKTRQRGKGVYQVVFNAEMNNVFVKQIKNRIFAKTDRAYYPAAQEWGFFNHWAGRYLPGLRFMRSSIDDNKLEIRKAVLNTIGREIDRALKG